MQATAAATSREPVERGAIAFGPFVFDRTSHFLSRDGVELPLPPRVLGVLALLVDRAGQLVTKQELMSAVWREAFVSETSLAEAISVLRQTLGDDPQRPGFIQTIHRRGYRFIAEVRDLSPKGGIYGQVVLPAGAGSHEQTATGVIETGTRGFPLQREDEGPRVSLLAPWIVTLFAILIAAVAVWNYLNTSAPPPRPVARFTIPLPAGVALSRTGAPVAVSPDGSLIAFAACGDECRIYLRPLSQAEPTLIAGTTGGASPFFSPDARWLGYFASGRLQKIALAGGSPVTLATGVEPKGATWTRRGEIVFAGSKSGGLSVAPAGGGPVRALTAPSPRDGTHEWPDALGDGSAVVFTVRDSARPDQHYAGIVSLRTGAWSRLLDGVSAIRAPLAGYLLAQRSADLVSVAFDTRSLSVAGLPVPVAAGLFERSEVPQFSMGSSGLLAIGRPQASALPVVLDWDAELRRLVPAAQPAPPR